MSIEDDLFLEEIDGFKNYLSFGPKLSKFIAKNCSCCYNVNFCSRLPERINICYGPQIAHYDSLEDCLFCGFKIEEPHSKTLYHENKNGSVETGHMHLKCFKELKEGN